MVTKKIERGLPEFWTKNHLIEESVALIGSENHMTILLQRFLSYKGYDVVYFNGLEEAKEAALPKAVIVNIDQYDLKKEYFFFGEEVTTVAYTKEPKATLIEEKGFSFVIPFPFDPVSMLKLLRQKVSSVKTLSR